MTTTTENIATLIVIPNSADGWKQIDDLEQQMLDLPEGTHVAVFGQLRFDGDGLRLKAKLFHGDVLHALHDDFNKACKAQDKESK